MAKLKTGGIFIAIYICDAPMGAGKTSAAITYMNEHPDQKFLFVTPYLTEVDRIKQACPALNFTTPSDDHSTKLDNLHSLLSSGQNIVSTHALFGMYNSYTEELLRNSDYTLIMDEVFAVIETMSISVADIDVLLQSGLAEIAEDGEHIRWLDDEYNGTKFQDVMVKAKANNLIRYKNKLLYWTFPVNTFLLFNNVYILTYLFDAQIQRYYYDMCGVSYEYIGTSCVNGKYTFSKTTHVPDFLTRLQSYVHILNDEKLNRIGDSKHALSATWYKEACRYKKKPLIEKMCNNLYNVFRHRFQSSAKENMWTCFKAHEKWLERGNYRSGFVSCNIRATNDYADRRYLAYCINVFLNPDIAGYFRGHNVRIEEDKYALSEMVQWIWRSAIRNGEEIWIYVPSKRMRDLLIGWINSFQKEDEIYK
ncbi:DEAD/DEAH box helicase family protein [candidate division WWE3 bacterium]|uniref:DEAD/DEAH box helicase family protein n=1 Tax=candidate division WWE3 bacterium TaxID=2053526 RepID=A0A7X9DK72_UNCKA|nr:DEAD/DEAH box helicase family protein [candidate division WWE3 bacterium]